MVMTTDNAGGNADRVQGTTGGPERTHFVERTAPRIGHLNSPCGWARR